jgi:DNA polymerase kappa
MISTSNYVARKYGVRSAMPGFIAKRLCPELVFVDCHYKKYKAASLQAQEVILQYNSNYIHDFGLDEFYVDITEYVHSRFQQQSPVLSDCPPENMALRACAEGVVAEIRQRICHKTGGLSCSAGIAHNFFLAKIGADENKPNGQYSLPLNRDDVVDFIRKLPCRKVGGIGKVTEKILNDLGMNNMGEVMDRLPALYHVLSSKLCYFFDSNLSRCGKGRRNLLY